MQEAENTAKQAANTVAETSESWNKYGKNAKSAVEDAGQALQKNRESLENYRDKAISATKDVTESLNLYSDRLKGLPKQAVTNLQVKVEDAKLAAFARKVHDVPKEKGTLLYLKDAFTNRLSYFNQQMQKIPTMKDVVLSIRDRFSGPLGSFAKGMLSVTAGMGVYNAGMAVATAVSNQFGAAVSRFDTLNNYPKVLESMGASSKDASESIKILSNGIQGLPTSLDQVASTSQVFLPITGNAKDAAKATLALNDAFLASGATAGDASRGLEQYKQMLSSGKVDMQSWRSLEETMPASLHKVAESFNISGGSVQELYKKLQSGQITMKQLNQRFVDLDGGAKGFHQTALNATGGIGTAFTNLKNRVTIALTGVLDGFNNMVKELTGNSIGQAINKMSAGIAKLGPASKQAFKAVGDWLKPLTPAFSALGSIIKDVFEGAIAPIKDLIGAIKDMAKPLADSTGIAKPLDAILKSIASHHTLFKSLGGVIGSLATALIIVKGSAALAATAFAGVVKAINGMKAIVGVIKGFKGLRLVLDGLKAAWASNPIGLIALAVIAVGFAFYEAYKHIKPFRDAVNGDWKGIKQAAKQFAEAGKKIKKVAKDIGKSIGDAFTGKAGWEKNLKKNFQQMAKDYDKAAKDRAKAQEKANRQAQKNWDNYWKGVSKSTQNAWKGITRDASNGMNAISKAPKKWSKAFQKLWNNGWNFISKYTDIAWQWIKKAASSGMDNVSKWINNGLNFISKAWNDAWSSLRDFFGNIWDDIKKLAEDGMNAVIGIINGGIGAIDSVWSFFTGHGSGIHKLSKVHFAQGGVVHRALSVVNDGPGDDWKELLQFPDGSLGMSQERNATLMLPVGTRVYSGPETKSIMNAAGVEHYATGGIVGAQHFAGGGIVRKLENFIAKIGDAISGLGEKFSAIEDFLEAPVQKVKNAIERAVGGDYAEAGHFGDLARGEWDKITSGSQHWTQHTLTAFLNSFEKQALIARHDAGRGHDEQGKAK